jgi:phenylacetic acid degradation protein
MKVPARKVVVGNPAKILKDVTDDQIEWKTEGTKIYQGLPEECRKSLKPCEPLRAVPPNRPTQMATYKPFKSR